MKKSPEAFRTISEVGRMLEVPTHVLRFWETRFSQIRPIKRAGGRRYYRPSDIELLSGIRRLLHEEGMTIRGVQKILREQGVARVQDLAPADLPVAVPDTVARARDDVAVMRDGFLPHVREAPPEDRPAEEPAPMASNVTELITRRDGTGSRDMRPAAIPRPQAVAANARQESLPGLETDGNPSLAPVTDGASAVLDVVPDAMPAPADATDAAAFSHGMAQEVPAPNDGQEPASAGEDAGATPGHAQDRSLASRLRALPHGCLSNRRHELAALAERIGVLRARMAERASEA